MECAYTIELGKANQILNDRTEKMVGEILTLIEAVVTSDRQTEAFKSTVKKLIWSSNREIKAEFEKLIKTDVGLTK